MIGAKKLFDVNSHSIDDLEADLTGKTKEEVATLFYCCFQKNDCINHFMSYWGDYPLKEKCEI